MTKGLMEEAESSATSYAIGVEFRCLLATRSDAPCLFSEKSLLICLKLGVWAPRLHWLLFPYEITR